MIEDGVLLKSRRGCSDYQEKFFFCVISVLVDFVFVLVRMFALVVCLRLFHGGEAKVTKTLVVV